MDKINIFKNIEKESLINFLKYEIRVTSSEWTKNSMIINIIVLLINVWLTKEKLLFVFIYVSFCVAILLSYIYYIKNIIPNKKNMCLFQGIYTGLWDVSFGTLALTLIEYISGKTLYMLSLLIIICTVFVGVITTIVYMNRIRTNYYKNYESKNIMITIPAMVVFLLVVRPLYDVIGRMYILAIAFIIIGLASVSNMIYFMLKFWGYSIVDEKDIVISKERISAKKASFSKYGKK